MPDFATPDDGYNGIMRRLCFLLTVISSAGACETRDEPYKRASLAIQQGMTEQQATAAAGAPSGAAKATVICQRDGGVRELLYDSTLVYFGGLKKDVHATVLVCIDSKGTVVSKHEIDF
jgi:hypothetical protein